MNKFVVYTSNLPFSPKNMEDVINFAKDTPKFRISSVELNARLQNINPGDIVITNKGNVIYIIKTITKSIEDWDDETKEYVDNLHREYGMKKVNITSVSQIVKFETWCKQVKYNKQTNMKQNSIKSFSERLKSMLMPTEVNDVRIATDGNICVATTQGYVSIDSNNNLVSYPEELTINLPVFAMCKPKEQLAVGDVIALDKSYAKVVKIDGDKISAISYTGSGKTIHTIKDFLFNQTMVRVVVSLAGNLGGQMNPMMLLALSKDDDKSSLLPLLMMSQNGGALGMNPMMLMLMSDVDTKDLLLYSAMSGNNLFNIPQQPAEIVE